MKTCPKCGKENEEGILFCEECDWRLDLPFKQKFDVQSNAFKLAVGALILGAIGAVCAFVHIGIVGIIAGGIGLFLSGYTQTLVRVADIGGDEKKVMIIATIGLLVSVIGFIYGIYVMF